MKVHQPNRHSISHYTYVTLLSLLLNIIPELIAVQEARNVFVDRCSDYLESLRKKIHGAITTSRVTHHGDDGSVTVKRSPPAAPMRQDMGGVSPCDVHLDPTPYLQKLKLKLCLEEI